jgi:uncharacterized protein YciI
MMHYLLFYDVVDDYMTRRAPLRAEHLGLARSALERGELVMGGALANPTDASVLVFRGPSQKVVEDFVRADPYVREGIVKSWRIREWTVVIGDGMTPP